MACAETPAPPCGMVVFGASGDLSQTKLIPAIAQLHARQLLSQRFCLVGCGRTALTDQAFRDLARSSIANAVPNLGQRSTDELLARTYYVRGGYEDRQLYADIARLLTDLDNKYSLERNVVFYMAVPPSLYPAIAAGLAGSGLGCTADGGSWDSKLVVEKPFGHDLASARRLHEQVTRCIPESRIYRIDHYLGKETVQNIMVLRFANAIFEPVWNRHHVDHVQITIAEQTGVGNRGGYYDQAGALRDMVQNHLLQLLALVAMEGPVAFEPEAIRDERVKVLRSLRPLGPKDLEAAVVRAQYGAGVISGREVSAYRDEPGVAPDSATETFFAARLFVDNARWKDIPFYVRTGKRLAKKDTHIAICFRPVAYSMFHAAGLDTIGPNVLMLRIQPQEGIDLTIQGKLPGSKLCVGPLQMSFDYQDLTSQPLPDAYQRLLLDCMLGDQTLFMRFDAVEQAWRFLQPILDAFANGRPTLHTYPAGGTGPAVADQLIQLDGRRWLPLGNLQA